MTDPHDFESALHDRMQEATRDVVADPALKQRLIDSAGGASSAAAGGSLRPLRFPLSWAAPAAAAVIILLVAGTVVAAEQLGSHTSVISGAGALFAGTSSPAPSATPPIALTSTPPTPTSSQPKALPTAQPSASVTIPDRPDPASVSNPGRPAPSFSPAPTGAPTHPGVPPVPPACSTPDTGEYHPTSVSDFTHHIVGTWLVCSEPSIFGTDDAGLQIAPDGHWAELTRNSAGQLVAGTSSLHKGSWVVIDDSSMNGHPAFQLNLRIDGSGTVIALAHFSSGVSRVHLDNNGVYEADYVPTSEPVN